VYFPEVFKGQNIGFNAAKLDNLKARLQAIITADYSSIESTVNELLRLTKPNYWNPLIPDNLEVRTEREFDTLMIILANHSKIDKNKITIFELYNLKQYIVESNKKNG